MTDEIAVGIGTIIVFGVLAQLLARRIGIPAILFLLVAGVVAGPVLELVDTDEIFGDALFPIVNLGVGLLLFQGGMELDFRRVTDRSVLPRLLTIGVVLTALLATGAVMLLFDFSTGESAILGAVLIVSGPTVVIPLLESARVKERVDGILRAEGSSSTRSAPPSATSSCRWCSPPTATTRASSSSWASASPPAW